MMWSCLTCAYLYEVQNRTEADSSTCPKCGKYQATGVSFARDIAEGQWNPAKGFFFGSPLGRGLVKGIAIAIAFTVARAFLTNLLALGAASEKFKLFTIVLGADVTMTSWLNAAGKSKSSSGYWFCAIVYGIIGLLIASKKGIWWGVFWYFYAHWIGLQLLYETVRHYF